MADTTRRHVLTRASRLARRPPRQPCWPSSRSLQWSSEARSRAGDPRCSCPLGSSSARRCWARGRWFSSRDSRRRSPLARIAPSPRAAVGLGALAWLGGFLSEGLWRTVASYTFTVVAAMLSVVYDDVVSRPERLVLGTKAFRVAIAPSCSGLEGVGSADSVPGNLPVALPTRAAVSGRADVVADWRGLDLVSQRAAHRGA